MTSLAMVLHDKKSAMSKNTPPLPAIFMAIAMRQCDTEHIA
jgi:hypothetical protein